MEENIIEIEGKKIDLSKLSNEELVELHKSVKASESKYKKLIEEYRRKYPFLRNMK